MNSRKLTCLVLALLTVIEVHCSISSVERLSVQIINQDTGNSSDVSALQIGPNSVRERKFEIDYERDIFLMNNEPFQFVAGSLHYFRSPHQYWKEKLRAMRAAGLNAVTTYVEWSFHEPEYRQYKWTGDKDLVKFIETAQEEDLYVILRPGPYICAERDMGGFPYWLLTRYPNIKLRTNDPDYESEVRGWYAQLMPKIQSLLYSNGGPIIMVQVENEYGSYAACDKVYMSWLAELTENWVRGDALLFTTDGYSVNALSCGSTPGAYATVDFGTGTNLTAAWEAMRKFSPRGPLVNSEFYPGWLTHWGENAISVSSSKVVETMEKMFAYNASFNFYMFHGGTNFAFTAGANLSPAYVPDITSYDYDAPMTEAGDPTPKFMAIRTTIGKYMPLPDIPIPAVKPKGAYGVMLMNPILALLGPDGRDRLSTKVLVAFNTKTMEGLGQNSGLVLYETTIPSNRPDPSSIIVADLRDRAIVYVDGALVGVLSRTRSIFSLPIMVAQGNHLQILVENQGRVNYGLAEDFKGIRGDVLLNKNKIINWRMTSFALETVESAVSDLIQQTNQQKAYIESAVIEGLLRDGPIMYSKVFTINEGPPLDTYLDVSGWGKGFVWLNDINLGRYWPGEGPQVTLYVPGVYFNPYPLNNTLIILEMQSAPKNFSIEFIDNPNLGHKKYMG
ncbi:ectoderm-expressed 3 [Arctopsyche grandis]|uniref:ectoderm-expressed 3 n=1 Tax=Arctopsyche grandis TaxID=121162 RepID=UPI00406D7950